MGVVSDIIIIIMWKVYTFYLIVLCFNITLYLQSQYKIPRLVTGSIPSIFPWIELLETREQSQLQEEYFSC